MLNINLISKYRGQLMGLAIIWVIAYHYFGKGNPVSLGNVFFAIGHGGVDMFLFLSGLGLVFSCWKTNGKIDYLEFLKKRILRIIPTYYIIIIFFGFILHKPIKEIIEQLLIFGFFFPMVKISSYDWYIPSLLVFYLMFPVFYKYFIESPRKVTLLAILSGLLATLALVFIQKGTVILFFSRIPVFFIGAYFAYKILKKEQFSKLNTILIMALFVLFLLFELVVTYMYNSDFLRKTALSHLPFMFIAPGLCMLLSGLFEKIQINLFGKRLLEILMFLGGISLEIYLIHMAFYEDMKHIPTVVALSITIVASYFLSILLKRLLDGPANATKA